MPLRSDLARIGGRIVDFCDGGGDVPFTLYQYLPQDEWAVRRDLGELRLWLQAESRRITCVPVSLAALFWSALEESGWLDELIAQERAAVGNADELGLVYQSVNEILTGQPSLADRVVAAVDASPERSAVFLYRAGALYPAYRTSVLLDDLRSRVTKAVTLLYPGRLIGDYGLSFMDRTEPAYGYRAMIVARDDDRGMGRK